MNGNTMLFREVQRWRDVWWVMALVFGVASLQWWGFFLQIVYNVPFGNHPAPDVGVVVFWLLFGVGLPLFFLWLHMVVEVRPTEIIILYRPFVHRRIFFRDITYVEPRIYRSLGEFGGWGIRGWGSRVAYNVSGNTGVELTLADGRRILIGSQRAAELAGTIHKVWGGKK